MILTPFSPCGIKCKILNVKNLWKCIFRAYRSVSFAYFPKAALDNKEGKGQPSIPFRIFVDHVTLFNSNPIQH